jgi:hypothetical protein
LCTAGVKSDPDSLLATHLLFCHFGLKTITAGTLHGALKAFPCTGGVHNLK